jgi:predicted acetyltransferase
MPAAIKPHIVTNDELLKIAKLGYKSFSTGEKSPEEFIKTYYSGLQLFQFLKEIDDLLKPLATEPVFKEIGFFDGDLVMLLIQYYSRDHDNIITGLSLSRAFIREKDVLIAEHDFFRIPRSARKKGIGKKMLALGLQQYLLMGVDKIKVHAALENGGYVWAKAFFTATDPKEVKAILDRAGIGLKPKDFLPVKIIYDNYYKKSPGGKNFPMVKWSDLPGMDGILSKSHWHGEIDLNNLELLAKFKNYVS